MPNLQQPTPIANHPLAMTRTSKPDRIKIEAETVITHVNKEGTEATRDRGLTTKAVTRTTMQAEIALDIIEGPTEVRIIIIITTIPIISNEILITVAIITATIIIIIIITTTTLIVEIRVIITI
jgi:hypothetical protein